MSLFYKNSVIINSVITFLDSHCTRSINVKNMNQLHYGSQFNYNLVVSYLSI